MVPMGCLLGPRVDAPDHKVPIPRMNCPPHPNRIPNLPPEALSQLDPDNGGVPLPQEGLLLLSRNQILGIEIKPCRGVHGELRELGMFLVNVDGLEPGALADL